MVLSYEELLKVLSYFERLSKESDLSTLDYMYCLKSPWYHTICIDGKECKLSVALNEKFYVLEVHLRDSVYLFDDLFTPLSDLDKQAHSVGKSVSDFLCACDSFAEVRFVISNPEDYFPLVSRDVRGTTKNLVYFKEGFIRYTWDTLGRRKAVVILP